MIALVLCWLSVAALAEWHDRRGLRTHAALPLIMFSRRIYHALTVWLPLRVGPSPLAADEPDAPRPARGLG